MLTKVSVLRLLIALLKERWCDIKSYDSYRRLFFLELCRGTLPQRVNYASYDFFSLCSDYQNTKVFPVLENSVTAKLTTEF